MAMSNVYVVSSLSKRKAKWKKQLAINDKKQAKESSEQAHALFAAEAAGCLILSSPPLYLSAKEALK